MPNAQWSTRPASAAVVCPPATSPAEPPVPSFPEISRGPRRALRGTESRQGASSTIRRVGFPPLPRLKVVGNSLREVDHDAEHGPINRRTDRHRGHCQSLGGDRPIVEPATSQSCLDERSESGWEAPHILCRNQHRQQRSRTHQEEKRLPIHHNSIDVPIAERRIGAGRDDLRCRQ